VIRFCLLAVEKLKGALLRLVARSVEALERLLARRRRLAAYNATALVEEKVLAGQTAACVVRRAVVHLNAAANTRTTRHGRIAGRIRGILTCCIYHRRILRVLRLAKKEVEGRRRVVRRILRRIR